MASGGFLVDRFANRAEAGADRASAKFAARLKALIDYLRSRYGDALEETQDTYQQEFATFVSELDAFLKQLDYLVDDVDADLDDALIKLSIIAAQLPGAREGLVLDHEPTFIRPNTLIGNQSQTVTVFGNGFSRAGFNCSLVVQHQESTCSAKLVNDGRIRVELGNIPPAADDNEAAEIRRLDLTLTVSIPRWWGLRSPKEIRYEWPLFLLPEKPVDIEVYPVKRDAVVVETKTRQSNSFRKRSGKSSHRDGCSTIRSTGKKWKIVLDSAVLRKKSSDKGRAWIDLRPSTPQGLRYCWNVKPAKKHWKKGHIKFCITYKEQKFDSQNAIDFDNPLFTGRIGWREQVSVEMEMAKMENWHLRGGTFWGKDIDHAKNDPNRIFDVVDEAKTKGLILIRLRDPSEIPDLAEFD